MSCQSAPGWGYPVPAMPSCLHCQAADDNSRDACFPRTNPSNFFIGFFEFGQGHRGPMIPYCPGAP
ncbi:unnamed protein product, partial [Staurois parvus]